MTEYKVTNEIKTSLIKKILRFFKLVKPLVTYKLTLSSPYFRKGDVLNTGYTKQSNIKVLDNGKRINYCK